MESFKEFQVKTVSYTETEFPCILEEIPFRLIPHLDLTKQVFCFLESAIHSETKGQYSILAFGSHFEISGEGSLAKIEDIISKTQHLYRQDLPMIGALYGYVSYNCVKEFESSVNSGKSILVPEGFMFMPKNIIIIDHSHNKIHVSSIYKTPTLDNIEEIYNLISHSIKEQIPHINSNMKIKHDGYFHENIGFYSKTSKVDYCKMVEKSIDYIKKGDIFQIVPSLQFYKTYTQHPLEFYQNLKKINPSPYMFYFSAFQNGERFNLIGASPEILINCKNNEVTLKPLAGTIKRGINEEEDEINMTKLLQDEKEIAEHLMLLDLGRNDVGKIATDVYVERQMDIEKYSHVMHISSTVKGKKKPDISTVDVLKSGLPAGTLSGAPKIRAMQIISEIEPISRDFYAGAAGYISSNILQTCIILRSALIKNNKIYTQAGAGVVFDSIPEKEYEECIQKITAIAKASL